MPFDQLALGFRVSSAGIVLTGQCSEGALLVSETKPLLYSRKEAVNCPITHLVHLFHLPKRDWLPHTRSSLNMARELPLPGDEGLNAPTIKK